MVRASTSKKTVKESSTGTTAKTMNVAKKTTARKTTKTTVASKAATTKQRAPKSSSKQAPTKTKTSTRACTTSQKTTTKVKASPVVPPTPVVEEKPKQVRKTKATKSVENNATDLVWVNPATGLTSTAHYDPTKQIVECKLSISDGKTDNPVTASFSLGVVKQLLQANYNIAVFVLQKSIYSFDFKRVDFEKFLRDNQIKLDLPKLAWV